MNRKRLGRFFAFFSIKKCVQLLTSIVMISYILLGSIHLYGEQTWHGNAAMIRRGEFETAGYFAASNSFPLNTKIMVKNLYNAQTTEVIVIQRLSDFYSVFLLLSDEAARELGMNENDVINVEVIVINFGTGDTIGLPDDLPYNPDPDVFPLPTIPEDQAHLTPYPTPYPTETPWPGESTSGTTPLPTPEITEEPRIEPTPDLIPDETIPPEKSTPEPTIEPSPDPTEEPTFEPTTQPLDEALNRNPRKNLFLLPHEDEMYVIEDISKPTDLKSDESVFELEIATIDIIDGKAIDGSISPPDAEEKEAHISSLEMKTPDVENPVIEDRTHLKENIVIEEYNNADEPVIVEKDDQIPEPSDALPMREEYDIALDPEEPKIPDELLPDPSNELPKVSGDEEIAMSPEEPEPPSDSDRGLPDPSNEIPEVSGDEEIAISPEEPEPPSEADRGLPDPSNELPEVSGDEEIAMSPEEPEPPSDSDRGLPDPSNELPDMAGDEEIAISPEEPEPPSDADRGIPDPSNELPEPEDEVDISFTPIDPSPPSEIDEGTETEPDIIYDPIDGEEEIIITFEETGPKPPPDTGDGDPLHEIKDGKESYIEGLEKGSYFIQLAAYTEKSPAQALERKYADIYPVNIYAVTDRMLEIYKVLVGPLNKHESDTLLYRFKALGFKDAFVKYSN